MAYNQNDPELAANFQRLTKLKREYYGKETMRRAATLGASYKGQPGGQAYAQNDPWSDTYMGRKEKLAYDAQFLPGYQQNEQWLMGTASQRDLTHYAKELDAELARMAEAGANSRHNSELEFRKHEANRLRMRDYRNELQTGGLAGQQADAEVTAAVEGENQAAVAAVAADLERTLMNGRRGDLDALLGKGTRLVGPGGTPLEPDPKTGAVNTDEAWDAQGNLKEGYTYAFTSSESPVAKSIHGQARAMAQEAVKNGDTEGLSPTAAATVQATASKNEETALKRAYVLWQQDPQKNAAAAESIANKVGKTLEEAADMWAPDPEAARAQATDTKTWNYAEQGDVLKGETIDAGRTAGILKQDMRENQRAGAGFTHPGPTPEALASLDRLEKSAEVLQNGGTIQDAAPVLTGQAAPAPEGTQAPAQPGLQAAPRASPGVQGAQAQPGAPGASQAPASAPSTRPVDATTQNLQQGAQQQEAHAQAAKATAQTAPGQGQEDFFGLKVPRLAVDSLQRSQQIMDLVEQYPEHPPFIELKNSMLADPRLQEFAKERGYEGMPAEWLLRRMQDEFKWKNRQAKVKARETYRMNVDQGIAPPRGFIQPIAAQFTGARQEARDAFAAKHPAPEEARTEPTALETREAGPRVKVNRGGMPWRRGAEVPEDE